MRLAEKSILLQLLDQTWKEHLLGLDHLRQGIGLRAYGQKDPLNEYKREAFDLFNAMLDQLRDTTTSVMCHLDLEIRDPDAFAPREEREGVVEGRPDPAMAGADPFGGAEPEGLHPAAAFARGPAPRGAALAGAVDEVPPGWTFYEPLGRHLDPEAPETWGKVPRNAACPCGSARKYKHCHGRVA